MERDITQLKLNIVTRTLFLFLTSMSLLNDAPEAKGANATDTWMISCVLMVFAALSEYGIILFIKFKNVTAVGKGDHIPLNISNSKLNTRNDGMNQSFHGIKCSNCSVRIFATPRNLNIRKKQVDTADPKDATKNLDTATDLLIRKLDLASLILFPIIFSVFITIYIYSYLLK